MKKQIIQISDVPKTVEVMYNDLQIAKSIEIAYAAPTLSASPASPAFPASPLFASIFKKQPPKKTPPPKPAEPAKVDNSMVLWALVDNINRGEIDKIPESVINDAIETLKNSASFSILRQMGAEEYLNNFAIYVIMQGKNVYNKCFTADDSIIDEYPPSREDLYETYVDVGK